MSSSSSQSDADSEDYEAADLSPSRLDSTTDEETNQRVRFSKVFSKEFSSIDPSLTVNQTPETTLKEIHSLSSLNSSNLGSENQPVGFLDTAPEVLIEASVGILMQAVPDLITSANRTETLDDSQEQDDFTRQLGPPWDDTLDNFQTEDIMMGDEDSLTPKKSKDAEPACRSRSDIAVILLRIIMVVGLILIVSRVLRAVTTVIYHLIFPMVTILVCSVLFCNNGLLSDHGFGESSTDLRRMGISVFEGCRQIYYRASDAFFGR